MHSRPIIWTFLTVNDLELFGVATLLEEAIIEVHLN